MEIENGVFSDNEFFNLALSRQENLKLFSTSYGTQSNCTLAFYDVSSDEVQTCIFVHTGCPVRN